MASHRLRFYAPGLRLRRALLLIASLVLTGCGRGDATDDRQYENWSAEARYVGRDACMQCHPDKVASFVRSQMGRSWKKAMRSLSDADWNDPEPVYAESENLYYQPFARGEDLFVKEYRIADGDTVHSRVEQIDFIVGSGHHTNSHIYSENGFLYQIPVTWYVQEGRWHLAPGFQELNSRFSRPIPEECMTCHNGRSPLVAGSENRFESVAEGIGCERCHGPGSVHIDAIRSGRAVDVSREIDPTIVNPGKLSPEREIDVCARCHMQAVDVFRPDVRPDDFRPGRKLSDYELVFWPRQPDSVTVFNMASHPDRLWMSRCFIATWDEYNAARSAGETEPADARAPMTCTTCHDPHVPIEEKPVDFYAQACLSCHETRGVPACADPAVAQHPQESDCASCHMPTSGTADIPHVTITDHFIRIPTSPADASAPEPSTEDADKIMRMAALVGENVRPSERALGHLNYYEKITDRPEMLVRADSLLRLARSTESEEALALPTIQMWYLQNKFDAIRRYASTNGDRLPEDAWTRFRVGEAFAESGDYARAVSYLAQAVDRAPGYLRFRDRLASTYSKMGDQETAIALYDELLAQHPRFESAVNNRGFALLMAGRFEEAERDFLMAISLNPDKEIALANLASLYANTDRREEAEPLVRRLLGMAPDNVQYRRLWQALGSLP